VVKVAGVLVPLSALSELALRLHEAREYPLANRLGRAIDSGTHEIALAPREQGQLLDAIERYPVLGLEELRMQLLERSRARMAV
jgi:hypothetical protein